MGKSYEVFYICFQLAKVFVPGRPFQLNLMLVGEVRSLRKRGALETCFTQVNSLLANIRLGWKGFPGTNEHS